MATVPHNLPDDLHICIQHALGQKPLQARVPDCGLSAALRYSVQLEDGSSVFVKAATDDDTEQWLRREHLMLSSAAGPWMPALIAWSDLPGKRPVLISEDLSHAYWPASHQGVSWRGGDIALLLSTVQIISDHKAIAGLPTMEKIRQPGWPVLAAHPESLLQLELCSARWLSRSLDALIDAETRTGFTGDRLLHGDLRSDNICILDGQVKLVDWSHAAAGAPGYDLAFLLPTLHLEGGPDPYAILPDGGGFAAAACAGHIRRLAADHTLPDWLKKVFRKLIAINLSWAAACLNLDRPDGKRWAEI